MAFNPNGFGGSKKVVDISEEAQKKKIKTGVIVVIIAIVVIILLSTSWYTVNDQQVAIVTTFGEVTDTTDAGFHFKIPFGIQNVKLVNTNIQQKIEIGYYTDKSGNTVSVEDESKMITGDFNIVNVDFFVEYQISNANKYLFASSDPTGILKNLVQSQVRSVVSSYAVDDVLTTKKSEIQSSVKELIRAELETYDIGLILVDIKIQDAEAPTVEVIEAFKQVETAKQDAETAVNDAKAYENAQIPQAEAKVDQFTQNAEYLKQSRINEAKKQVSMFDAIYAEYSVNKTITKKRMYYEAIESILPGVKIYIVTYDDGGTQMLLPLGDLMNSSAE